MEDKEAPNSVFNMRIKGMAMLTVCSVFSLRNLPSMAEYLKGNECYNCSRRSYGGT